MKTTPRPGAKISLTEAINAIRSTAQNLRAQIDAKTAEQRALEEELRQLDNMPVCFEDWLPSLKSYIHACGQQAAPSGSILPVRGHYTKPFNKRTVHELGGGPMYFHEVIGGGPDREHASPFSVLCFYFPEVVFARLSEHYRQAVGSAWGNEDLPRLEERNRRKADLIDKLKTLAQELAALRAELAELSTLEGARKAPAPVVIGEPEALDTQAES